MKLEVTKLDQSPIDIHGYYVNNGAKDLPASLHVEWDACDMVQCFSNLIITKQSSQRTLSVPGMIRYL